jgi:hypothetical protein
MSDRRPSLTASRFAERLRKLEADLDGAHAEHWKQVQAWADAERDYKKAYAQAILSSEEKTVAEREARADIATADLRHAWKLAEGLAQSALEAIRSRRTKVSAVQSLLSAYKEEAAFSRVGPT